MNEEQYKNKIETLLTKLQDAKDKKSNSSLPLKSFKNWFHSQLIKVDTNIDRLIKLLFYLCIIGGVFFAVFNFSSDIYKAYKSNFSNKGLECSKIHNTGKKSCHYYSQNKVFEKTGIEKKNQHDLNLLKFIEHIFIYLIPLLIFLGLYFYYIINFSHHFTGARTHSEQLIKRAKNSIQLTKTLFISSMMAYVIIKIIEKLFLDSDFDFNIKETSSYGIFLLLLMSYLILTHKSHD